MGNILRESEMQKTGSGNCRFYDGFELFFISLREWILGMDDSRNQDYIKYTQADLGYMAILKNICGQHSMREMEENFNMETCIDTLRRMSGNRSLDEMPHYDIPNYYPESLSDLRRKMVTSLIRGNSLTGTGFLENTGG